MESKYYIPSIEEFHVGFEYEITDGYEWVKKIFSHDDFNTFLYKQLYNAITQELVRVKYLDKEDIESLGWNSIMKKNDLSTDTEYFLQKENIIFTLIHYNKIGITIYKNNTLGYIFKGTIKNKSELKVLLKQLGI